MGLKHNIIAVGGGKGLRGKMKGRRSEEEPVDLIKYVALWPP